MLRSTTIAVAAALCALLAGAGSAAPAAPAKAEYGNRAMYFRLVDDGIGRTESVWWNPQANWYDRVPYTAGDGPRDVATVWDAFGLFEAVDLVAISHRSPARTAAVESFARGAERYWDPYAKGYWYLPNARPGANVYFDDNGWLGLAFFDAYTATHDRRFLNDALRAYRFIKVQGWSKNGGGIWWDTQHEWKTIEPLAAEALLGAELYRTTRARTYLRETRFLISWADHHSWNRQRGLYQRNSSLDTVMNYAEGMMIGADALLCRTLRTHSDCRRAEQLANASARAFPLSYHWAPETDAIYLRGLLQLWAVDHNPRWYGIADYWVGRAVANARDSSGLFTKRWDGDPVSYDRLLTPGGTLMLLAAVTAAPAPAH